MSDRDLAARLNAFRSHFGNPSPPSGPPHQPSRYQKLAEFLGAELVSAPAGSYCLVTTTYPAHYGHGQCRLGDIDATLELPVSAFTANDVQGTVESSKLLFVDTETTGLGGAGAVPFLIGVGRFVPDGFEVRQYLIPDYPDETAMLEAIQTELTPDRALVTYNGAAFDLPLLSDRLVINRVARGIPDTQHFDLLHSARRLFKRRIRDCSLVSVERELFGFHRVDDVPGYLVPSVYFSWLADETLDLLPRVLEHNRLDIVSLAFLAHRVADIFAQEGEPLSETDDIHSLARVYGRRRHLDKVVRMGARLEVTQDRNLASDILLYHARAFKRTGRWAEAVGIWELLTEREGREAYWACLELAKYYEHEVADISKALRLAHRAQQLCPYGARHDERLSQRLARLQGRLPAEP